jgi:hypothetical protein
MSAGLFLIATICLTAAIARPQQREKSAVAAPKASAPAVPLTEQSEMVAPSVSRPRADYQFPIGQTYVYGAEWRVFNAGIATLRMEKAGQENRIVATANAAGIISPLSCPGLAGIFLRSWTCSQHFRHIEEGFRRAGSASASLTASKAPLDHKEHQEEESKHEEHDIPGCVIYTLSSVYYVASLPLLPGKT